MMFYSMSIIGKKEYQKDTDPRGLQDDRVKKEQLYRYWNIQNLYLEPSYHGLVTNLIPSIVILYSIYYGISAMDLAALEAQPLVSKFRSCRPANCSNLSLQNFHLSSLNRFGPLKSEVTPMGSPGHSSSPRCSQNHLPAFSIIPPRSERSLPRR